MKAKSTCCNAPTRIGYFNRNVRPDIYGIQYATMSIVIGDMGTYCCKCGKLTDYKIGKKEYYTNGVEKNMKDL